MKAERRSEARGERRRLWLTFNGSRVKCLAVLRHLEAWDESLMVDSRKEAIVAVFRGGKGVTKLKSAWLNSTEDVGKTLMRRFRS